MSKHGVHVETVVCAVRLECVFAAQLVHAPEPVVDLNFPAVHAPQVSE